MNPYIRSVLTTLLLILVIPVIAQQKITILHTNDLHSSVLPTDATNINSQNTGGLARIATLIQKEKSLADHPVIAVDAGDFLMGTLFQMLEIHSGFQLQLMKEMGYDAVSIGNHEFDFGVEDFGTCVKNASAKGCPPLILSNIGHSRSRNEDVLETLYGDSILHHWIVIEKEGLRIGIFGLLGDIAYEYTPNLHDYKAKDRIRTAREAVDQLRNKERADIIICLSHSGVYKDEEGQWLNIEDVELAQKVKGIDAIISGHTHTVLKQPLIVNGIPIVQTGTKGQYLGKLEITLGTEPAFNYELIPVDNSVSTEHDIQDKIMQQFGRLKDSLQITAGIDYEKICFETSFPLTFIEDDPESTNIGPFIADAIYDNINKNSVSGTDVALIAQGMIRTGIEPGNQHLSQVYQAASLGNGNDNLPGYALARMYLTAHEIKVVFELLHLMAEKDPNYYCFTSGIEASMNEEGGFLHKVTNLKLKKPDGFEQEIDFSKKNKQLYAVTADTYMIQSLSVLKKKTFGLVQVNPKNVAGQPITDLSETIIDHNASLPGIQEGKVWHSVVRFAETFEDTNNNGIPDLPDRYK